MIVKLNGFVDFISNDAIHIEVSGVVFKVFLSTKDIRKLPKIGEKIVLNIHEILREDARYLFGFLMLDDKLIFEDLIKVQGVGGKMALNILGIMEVNEIVKTVKDNNIVNFTKISGIGNKVSQRLINELRDKIDKNLYLNHQSENFIGSDSKYEDLLSCLINLGYQQKVSDEIVRKVLKENLDKNLEELIPISLKLIKIHNVKS